MNICSPRHDFTHYSARHPGRNKMTSSPPPLSSFLSSLSSPPFPSSTPLGPSCLSRASPSVLLSPPQAVASSQALQRPSSTNCRTFRTTMPRSSRRFQPRSWRCVVVRVGGRRRGRRRRLTCDNSSTTQSTTKHTSIRSTKRKKNTPLHCAPATSPLKLRCSLR